MIKSEKGNVQLSGLGIEILADFGTITYALFKSLQKDIGEEAEPMLRTYFESALKKIKQVPEEPKDVLDEIEELLKIIKEIKQHDRN